MGEVYLATNMSLGRNVAIKVLNRELTHNEDDVLRFLREARAAAAVRHPNVVDVLDVARDDDGTPFIVQELLKGEDLEQYLQTSGGQLRVEETLEIMIPVTDAVSAAHERNLVHRDLKPANIFLAREGTRLTPKVLDFGACLYQTVGALSSRERRMLIGTPHYMAPEQITSKEDLDVRADVWAIGVILYELLVGETPFEGPSESAVLALVRSSTGVPSVRARAPGVPQALEMLIAQCMDHDRSKRPRSAESVHAALNVIRSELRHGRRIDLSETLTETLPAAPPARPIAIAEARGSRTTRRRGASLLTLSSPDDEDVFAPAKTPDPPLESTLKVEFAPRDPGPLLARHAPVSSLPPILDPRAFAPPHVPPSPSLPDVAAEAALPSHVGPETKAVEEVIRLAPKPALVEEAPRPPPVTPPAAPSGSLSAMEAPAKLGSRIDTPRSSSASTPVWTPRDRAELGGYVLVPAVLGFVALEYVTFVSGPLGRALRGEDPIGSGIVAIAALAATAALAVRVVSPSRTRPITIATIGTLLLGVIMIIVTFSAGEAAELGIPPAASELVPFVAPIAPIGLLLAALGRARIAWLSPYERREGQRFAFIASVMLLAVLELGPAGAVRHRTDKAAAGHPERATAVVPTSATNAETH
ncbi:Serine/threonine protein kinase [Labilithrix luteola]|uniref:Serine/threonine protein kinase n=2 Tax=Labilithrix luteola TaxID=1391654 RepID=A0A0K1QAA6_9BACT|nr:Serine/threonine protein kinase [Labilithrix luteola]